MRNLLRRWAVLVAVVLVTSPFPASEAQVADGPTYTFYSAGALADGVAADIVIRGFLPIEEVGFASITSESRLGVGQAEALAALPDPGDLVLGLPSTISALLGIAGVPGYPAAARATHPDMPEDERRLLPDAGLGGFTLRTTADEDAAEATAFVGNQVDTVGLIPSFSIGSVRTIAETRRLHGSALESVATTTVNDIRMLGALVRIKQVTTEVRLSVVDGEFEVQAHDATISGAEVAGMPVGVTDDGIVGLGQPAALAPIIATLTEPLASRGIKIRTAPATRSIESGRAVARGGTLEIEVPFEVQGYPATLTLSVGRATTGLEVGGAGGTPGDVDSADGGEAFDGGGTVGAFGGGIGGAPDGTFALAPGAGAGVATSPAARRGATAGGGAGTGRAIALPAPRRIASFDVAPLYRWMLLAGIVMFVLSLVVIRTSRRGGGRSDIRHLWRW